MESMDQKSSDNDSHNQRSEEISADLNLVSQDPEGEVGLESPAELGSNSVSLMDQESCIPKLQETNKLQETSSQASDLENHPEEQSKIESDSSPTDSWDNNKGQSMESILADWNEDIEAFEMMEKDEL